MRTAMIFNSDITNLKGLAPISGADAQAVFEFLDIARVLPVDPFEIAKKLGIEILSEDRGNTSASGRIDVLQSGEIQIWINPRHHINRQRFTMAHELGHFIRDILPKLLSNKPTTGFEDSADFEMTFHRFNFADEPEEIAANFFAANLLMPAKAVKKYSGESKDELAKRFQVSPRAIEKRMEYLGL